MMRKNTNQEAADNILRFEGNKNAAIRCVRCGELKSKIVIYNKQHLRKQKKIQYICILLI